MFSRGDIVEIVGENATLSSRIGTKAVVLRQGFQNMWWLRLECGKEMVWKGKWIAKMEDKMNEEIPVIYSYTRKDAIEDGTIFDATEYLKNIPIPLGSFKAVYMTRTLFEDITSMQARNAIDTLSDLVETAVKNKLGRNLMGHFNLSERVIVFGKEEDDQYILEMCYASED